MHFINFILYLVGSQEYGNYTARNQYRKFETHIPRKGTARPQSHFPHSRVCERFLYSHDRSAYFCCRKILGLRRRAIPRKGIHKWDFRCSVLLFMNVIKCEESCFLGLRLHIYSRLIWRMGRPGVDIKGTQA